MQLERVLLPAAAGIFLNSLFWQTAGLGKSVDAVSRLAAVVSIAAYAASVLAANAGALTLCSPMLAGCVTAVHAGYNHRHPALA